MTTKKKAALWFVGLLIGASALVGASAALSPLQGSRTATEVALSPHPNECVPGAACSSHNDCRPGGTCAGGRCFCRE